MRSAVLGSFGYPTYDWFHGIGRLIGHLLGLRLVLIGDIDLDRARRRVREVLIAVNRAARHVDALAGLEDARRFAPDGERDLALLHRPPLIARMAVELVARARRNHHRLHSHD